MTERVRNIIKKIKKIKKYQSYFNLQKTSIKCLKKWYIANISFISSLFILMCFLSCISLFYFSLSMYTKLIDIEHVKCLILNETRLAIFNNNKIKVQQLR